MLCYFQSYIFTYSSDSLGLTRDLHICVCRCLFNFPATISLLHLVQCVFYIIYFSVIFPYLISIICSVFCIFFFMGFIILFRFFSEFVLLVICFIALHFTHVLYRSSNLVYPTSLFIRSSSRIYLHLQSLQTIYLLLLPASAIFSYM